MTSTNSGVSYYQVYKRWLSVDHRRNKESIIPVTIILSKLRVRGVVDKLEDQTVNHEIIDERKSMVKISAHFSLIYLNNRRLD